MKRKQVAAYSMCMLKVTPNTSKECWQTTASTWSPGVNGYLSVPKMVVANDGNTTDWEAKKTV